jgi:CMP-N,N'-diacetyllegionaminic acid synthase
MVLATICARSGSKGILGKNLRTLNGKSLILWTVDCALSCEELDEIILSTDDPIITQVCEEINTQPRPPELATDTASKWDVFRYIAKENNLKPDDILVDLDTGCPLREPQDITNCVRKLQSDKKLDVVFPAYESDRNPYFNMVEVRNFGEIEIIKYYCGDIITRRQDAPKVWSLTASVCAVRVSALLKHEHWSLARMGIVEIPRVRGLDIDTQDDWDYVEFLMQKKYPPVWSYHATVTPYWSEPE